MKMGGPPLLPDLEQLLQAAEVDLAVSLGQRGEIDTGFLFLLSEALKGLAQAPSPVSSLASEPANNKQAPCGASVLWRKQAGVGEHTAWQWQTPVHHHPHYLLQLPVREAE